MKRLVFLFALLSIIGLPAHAQWAPSKPIRVIVPYAPVGTSDIIARTMSDRVRERLGQPFLIENQPGASTQIGTTTVAKAAPDGHTLLLVANTFAVNPSLFKSLPYDPVTSVTPVTYAGVTPHTMLVNLSLPVHSLKDLIAYAKKNPGKLSYGSVGNGTSFHLGMEQLKKQAGIFVVHIPYRGMGQVLTDLLAGHIDVALANTPNAVPYVESGKLRAIGVADLSRSPQMANVPTIAEQGIPGFESNSWFVFFATGGTPEPILDRLNAVLVAVLREPAVEDSLTKQGLLIKATTRAEAKAFITAETAKYAELVKFSGAKID